MGIRKKIPGVISQVPEWEHSVGQKSRVSGAEKERGGSFLLLGPEEMEKSQGGGEGEKT